MLRKIRITLAVIFFVGITALFLDFTGVMHAWFGWMAKMQFWPAVLAMNVGVVLLLIVLTFLLGRVYCSIICPLGVFQDVVAWMGGKVTKNRYSYSPAKQVLRYVMLCLFVVAAIAGVGSLVALLAPYSSYGRIASNLLQPVYVACNNLLAMGAERIDSYRFYSVDVWMKSLPTFIIAAVTLVVLVILAWRNGRTYCNTICPVGTILSFVARYAWLKPVVDTSKCNGCGLCARNCKAACILAKEHRIDYSRCVSCMDCIDTCRKGAISYRHSAKGVDVKVKEAQTSAQTGATVDKNRRSFLTATAVVATASLLKAQDKTVDGGLAAIEDKKIPTRATAITPAGSLSARHLAQHCTACQLCVSACPNGVLRPSTDLLKLMQPEMSYERGYCRPECTRCADVCPAGAIRPITKEEKSSVQIGHAVWIKKNCVPLTDGVECGNCARHCPSGAIQMVASVPEDLNSPKIPVIDTERCIGCGACENLCPARPFSAIYVEGNEVHHTI